MPKNHKTKLVLFDLDGTLIDTAPDFLYALNKILKNNGGDAITEEEIRFHISEGTSKMIKTFFKIEQDDVNFKKYKDQFSIFTKGNTRSPKVSILCARERGGQKTEAKNILD